MSEARSLKGAGLRYSSEDGVPAWAAGKTADEILAIASQAVGHIQAQSSTPAYTQNVQIPQAPDPELAYRDPVAYAREYAAYSDARVNAQLAQVGAPVYGQLAAIARQQSKTGRYADVWRRWEPEIEIKLAGIPAQQRTLELYDQAAQMVKADHIDEIAREQAEKLMAAGGTGTERSSGAGGAPPAAADPLEAAFAGNHPFFVDAKANGLSPASVRRFLEQTGQTAEEYIRNATRGSVVVTKEGFQRSHG